MTTAVHVLLVEDDDVLRGVLARHLMSRGYRVVEAATAEAAAGQLDRGIRPDVVLLDLNLTGATGWELLRSQPFDAAGSPPVVVMTATTVDPRRLRQYAAAGYLPKPFAMESLVATVERFAGPRA